MASSRRHEQIEAAGAPASLDAAESYDPIAEQQAAHRARTERDRRLTSAERLQRLHALCAQLATVTPARPHETR